MLICRSASLDEQAKTISNGNGRRPTFHFRFSLPYNLVVLYERTLAKNRFHLGESVCFRILFSFILKAYYLQIKFQLFFPFVFELILIEHRKKKMNERMEKYPSTRRGGGRRTIELVSLVHSSNSNIEQLMSIKIIIKIVIMILSP